MANPLPCGCAIITGIDYDEIYQHIEFCHLHAAALLMLAVLRKLRNEFDDLRSMAEITDGIDVKPSAFEKLVIEIDAAIAAAEKEVE